MVALLAAHPNQVSVNDVRNKINEILNEGIGGAVTTDPNPPSGTASDGDLWFDETNAILYVYTDSVNGWVQTNGGGGGGGGTPAGADNQVQFNDNGSFGASNKFTFDGGTVTVPRLHVSAMDSANEGGEIALEKPPNSTLNGGIILDMFIDSLRIFEGASPFKGAYLDLNECGNYLAGTQTNLLSGGGGSGFYSTGWTTSIPSAHSEVTYTHNLSSEDIIYKVYVRDTSGKEHDITGGEAWAGITNANCNCVNITSTQITIKFLDAYLDWSTSSGSTNPTERAWSTATHIKVVVSAGAIGPRAYVTFDGTSSNLTSSIFNSFNVSSITDNNVGDYTINYQNQVPTPVVTAMVGEDITNQTDLANQNINLYDATNSSIRVRINQDSAGYSAGARDKGYVSVVVH